jgi:CheY-like chemotaxis protein
MKILVVDDEKSLRELYDVLFRTGGYEVKTSSNGLTAITDVVDFRPDVVLLDIMMPEMNGYGFLDALQNNTSLRPVVMVFSNLGEQTEIDRAMSHGADAYLRKSDFTGEQLVSAVSRVYTDVLTKRNNPEPVTE